MLRSFRSPLALMLAAGLLGLAHAQPSGGPYGPVEQTYVVPANAAHVYYVAPEGQPNASGATPDQPTTLASAFDRVVTNDVVVLRGGTYRTGNLQFNQGITLQPYGNEHPILKGTEIAKDWTSQPNGLWRITWPTLFPDKPQDWWRRESSGRKTPPYRFNNDMVFVDGRMLHAVGWEGEIDANTYYIDYDKKQVYIGIDPQDHVIEITTFDNAFTRVNGPCHGRAPDHQGPTIRGITFTEYAFRALEIQGKEAVGLQDPATFGKDVVGTTLENVTITHCSRVAGYFRGDHLTIRNCLVSDTRTEGIFVLSSGDALIERNILRRNNVENIDGYFPAAVKIFDQCYHAVVRDNLILDNPNSNAVWWDVGGVDGRFVNNYVENAINGFFFEISKGAVCVGNVFVDCDEGSRVLNSSNVHVYHNTYLNAQAVFDRTERSAVNDHFGWHPSTGPDVDQREGHLFAGNLLVEDARSHREMLLVQQANALCGKLTHPMLSQVDGNVYLRRGLAPDKPLIIWSPAAGENCTANFDSLDAFHKEFPQFDPHSMYVPDQYGAVFAGPAFGNFRPVRSFASDAAVPDDVRRLAGWPSGVPLAAGAYPLTR